MTMDMSGEEFQSRMAPLTKAIREFALAVRDVRDRHGNLPDAASPGMFGGLTPLAAGDYVHGLGGLFDSAHPPLYAHLPLDRALRSRPPAFQHGSRNPVWRGPSG
jgi:hypothetical protein